jgi:sugar/nucleoside kinase (ribokinase family)
MSDLLRLRGKNFVIIGRAGMDFYPEPPGTRTEHATHFFSCLGGSSANIGVALVKLGGKADLVTCVSHDAIGRFALNELDRYGVGRAHVRSVGGEARNSLAVVETTIEDHQSVIYRNGAADFEMNLADVEAVDYAGYSGAHHNRHGLRRRALAERGVPGVRTGAGGGAAPDLRHRLPPLFMALSGGRFRGLFPRGRHV